MTDPKLLEQLEQAIAHLHQELNGLRTGRAVPTLVENIPVLSYGTMTPLQQLASISAPEPQQLLIQPWDPSLVKDIEKAIAQSPLGINPVVDGKMIRLPFPPMTDERRQQLIKVVKEKTEEARVRIRGVREETVKKLRQQEKEGVLSEDQLTVQTKELQAQIDQAVVKVENQAQAKETELQII